MRPPTNRPRARFVLAAAAVGIACAAGPARALDLTQMVRGQVHPRIPTETDRAMTFALYLPRDFDPGKRWPLLLVFDPRKRGEMSAQLFADAAERRGWIVASSNDTESDVATWDGNIRAVNALFPDLKARLPIDERRIYAAGMSGGAMLAWIVGQKSGALAGVIAVGGRPPEGYVDTPPRFALWAAGGRLDFNHDASRMLDDVAARGDRLHRFERFEGPHGWFDGGEAARAVDWLEVVAIREGRRPAAPALVEEIHRADLAGAEALLAAGDVLAGLRRLQAIATTYRGLVDVGEVERRAAALERDAAVRKALKDEEWGERYEASVRQRIAEVQARLPMSEPTSAHQQLGLLNVRELRTYADKDGARGDAARRAVALAHVLVGFYSYRELLADGKYARAAIALEIAVELRPEDAVAWYNLACARARDGAEDEALAALTRALDLGVRLDRPITEDPDLQSLQNRPDFRALAARESKPSG